MSADKIPPHITNRAEAAAYAAQLEDQLVDDVLNQFEARSAREQREQSSLATSGKVAGPEPAPPLNVDELAADLKRHPFFATSLDDLGEDNPEYEALKALAYEGTRAEIAENFRQQGNDCAKTKDWSNAKDYYGQALAALRTARREDELEELNKEEPGWEEREEAKELGLKEKCLSNRALCHLNLRNYRSCSFDCISTLEINPRNVKAHYRLAQALLALSKLDEALKTVDTGLLVESDNSSLTTVKDLVEKAITKRDEKEKQQQIQADRRAQEDHVLRAALAARQIKTRTTKSPPDLEDARVTLTPDPVSPTSSLVVPVLVLYPMHGQTDFIKAFGEEQTLLDHLEYLLPLPWDEKSEYGDGKADKVEAYLETAEGGLVKWGRKAELLKLLSGGKVEIVDSIVTVNIVPKAKSSEWIQEHKRRRVKF